MTHNGAPLFWSALVLAGSVVSAGCSSSQISGGAYRGADGGAYSGADGSAYSGTDGGARGGADGNAPPCGASTCAGTCTSGRCFVTLSTPPSNPCEEYDLVLGQTALYWLDAWGNVTRVPTAGGAATTLASTASTHDQLAGLAVDAADVYWSGGAPDGGYIAKAPASGGQPTTITSGLNSAPSPLATDGTNLYWTAFDSAATSTSVLSMPVGGGTLATLASSMFNVTSLFTTRGQLYLSTGDGRVLTVPASGGTPRQLAYEETGGIAVVADSAAAYWTNTAGDVMRLPLDGSAATVLATGQTPTHALAIDESSIYWINSWTDPCVGSAVMKVPLEGGALTTLASPDGEEFMDLAVDQTGLYLLVAGLGVKCASSSQPVLCTSETMSVVKVTPK